MLPSTRSVNINTHREFFLTVLDTGLWQSADHSSTVPTINQPRSQRATLPLQASAQRMHTPRTHNCYIFRGVPVCERPSARLSCAPQACDPQLPAGAKKTS